MLLSVDIGNTSINNGIFDGRILKKTFRVPTYAKAMAELYVKRLSGVRNAVIVSVVPKVLGRVERICERALGKKVMVVGRDISSGIKNRYRNPRQVGQDRLVNARAAYEMYGGPCIIVDFGTAITIDVVSKKKEYIGGLIVPGIEISLSALSEKAAMLPRVRLKKPKGVLGRETRESMVNGAVYGFASLCDGVVERLKKIYGAKGSVIATGGTSKLIGPYCNTIKKIDPELTLEGLRLIGAENNV